MRDEMDSRLWLAHHEAFADDIDQVLQKVRSTFARVAAWEKVRSTFARVAAWDGTTHQLLALLVSFSITAITFRTTAI